MSQAQRAEPATLTAEQLLAEMHALYREIGTASRAQRPPLEAQMRAYTARYQTLTEETPMAVVNTAPIPIGEQCVLCHCRLTTAYLIARGLCGSCADRPEAKRVARDSAGRAMPSRPQAVPPPVKPAAAPAFGPAAKALIKHMHAYVPAGELLGILNERLVADVGPSAVRFTLEQLQAELQASAAPAEAGDWGGLRKLLADARSKGVLATITATTIDDFAVLFQLSAAQAMTLKDVIQHAKEER